MCVRNLTPYGRVTQDWLNSSGILGREKVCTFGMVSDKTSKVSQKETHAFFYSHFISSQIQLVLSRNHSSLLRLLAFAFLVFFSVPCWDRYAKKLGGRHFAGVSIDTLSLVPGKLNRLPHEVTCNAKSSNFKLRTRICNVTNNHQASSLMVDPEQCCCDLWKMSHCTVDGRLHMLAGRDV